LANREEEESGNRGRKPHWKSGK